MRSGKRTKTTGSSRSRSRSAPIRAPPPLWADCGTPGFVLAPHFYPGAVDLGGTCTGPAKLLVQAEFAAWKGNMRLGAPLWIGELLVRPYPRAIAGTPTEISYARNVLKVGWRNRQGVSGPTEVWLPAAAFPGTPNVSSSDPAGRWRLCWDAARRLLYVWADPGTSSHILTVRR